MLFNIHRVGEDSLSVAPYVPSPENVIREMLDLSHLREGEVLYDLGCGDGGIVIIAARDYLAKAYGVEIRKDLVITARRQIDHYGLQGKAKIIRGDLFKVDLSKAAVVTLYLTSIANDKLKPKLEKELRPNTRVVSHDFSIPGWHPSEVSNASRGHTIYLYIIPRP
jgi:predicted RNA methylase